VGVLPCSHYPVTPDMPYQKPVVVVKPPEKSGAPEVVKPPEKNRGQGVVKPPEKNRVPGVVKPPDKNRVPGVIKPPVKNRIPGVVKPPDKNRVLGLHGMGGKRVKPPPKAHTISKAGAVIKAKSKARSWPGAVPKTPFSAYVGATARRFFATVSKAAALGTVPKAAGISGKAPGVLPGLLNTAHLPPSPPPPQKPPPPPAPKPPWRKDAASSAANAADTALVKEKALAVAVTKVPPPWRRKANIQAAMETAPEPGVPAAAEEDKDDDSDYDPFTEVPAPHIQEDKANGQGNEGEAAPSLSGKKSPPWRQTSSAEPQPAEVKADSTEQAQVLQGPVLPPSQPKKMAVPRRMRAGAKLAQEYFTHAENEEEAPQKRQRVRKARFAAELLAQAPSSLQTCRSLTLFLKKKLEPPAPAAPAVECPQDLRTRVEAYADSAGRLAGLREASGWDARARRALDVGAHAATAPGTATLEAASGALEREQAALERALKERGEGTLEALAGERRAWAQAAVKREWLTWCAQLLRAKEAMALAEGKGQSSEATKEADAGEDALGMGSVLEALLAGTGCPMASTGG